MEEACWQTRNETSNSKVCTPTSPLGNEMSLRSGPLPLLLLSPSLSNRSGGCNMIPHLGCKHLSRPHVWSGAVRSSCRGRALCSGPWPDAKSTSEAGRGGGREGCHRPSHRSISSISPLASRVARPIQRRGRHRAIPRPARASSSPTTQHVQRSARVSPGRVFSFVFPVPIPAVDRFTGELSAEAVRQCAFWDEGGPCRHQATLGRIHRPAHITAFYRDRDTAPHCLRVGLSIFFFFPRFPRRPHASPLDHDAGDSPRARPGFRESVHTRHSAQLSIHSSSHSSMTAHAPGDISSALPSRAEAPWPRPSYAIIAHFKKTSAECNQTKQPGLWIHVDLVHAHEAHTPTRPQRPPPPAYLPNYRLPPI